MIIHFYDFEPDQLGLGAHYAKMYIKNNYAEGPRRFCGLAIYCYRTKSGNVCVRLMK